MFHQGEFWLIFIWKLIPKGGLANGFCSFNSKIKFFLFIYGLLSWKKIVDTGKKIFFKRDKK